MSGLKRPYPDGEEPSSAHPPFFAGKRKLLSTSEAVRSNTASAALQWTTASIEKCDETYCDDITRANEPSPVSWLSSPSSDNSLEVLSSTEGTGTPFTHTSSTKAPEVRDESNEIEICFGMVGAGSSLLTIVVDAYFKNSLWMGSSLSGNVLRSPKLQVQGKEY